jgi:hypothetical protein
MDDTRLYFVGAFTWTDGEGKPVGGTTVWSIAKRGNK